MHPRYFLRLLLETRERFGWRAMFKLLLVRTLNLVCYFEPLHIIALDRGALKPLDADASRFSSRVAGEAELLELQAKGDWQVDEVKLGFHRDGDSCVLSFVDGRTAGYTWVHTDGRPEIMPGLRLAVPANFLYNYAGFTHPDFRGGGLQSYRHRSVLDNERWTDRRALLGYVLATNFASQRGQDKSGYRRIGTVWLVGTRKHFAALFSKSLRDIGIGRIPNRGAMGSTLAAPVK